MSEFDEIVNRIMATTQCDRTKAEATARLNGYKPSTPAPELERDTRVLEKAEQWEVTKVFVAFGFKVYNLSQARASKQTPGLSDLWCVHTELPIAFWWETKRQAGGEHSGAQRDFAAECVRCHVGYGTGDRFAARSQVINLGLAHVVGGILEPIRPIGEPACR